MTVKKVVDGSLWYYKGDDDLPSKKGIWQKPLKLYNEYYFSFSWDPFEVCEQYIPSTELKIGNIIYYDRKYYIVNDNDHGIFICCVLYHNLKKEVNCYFNECIKIGESIVDCVCPDLETFKRKYDLFGFAF